MRGLTLLDALQFACLIFLALALIPAGAHLFELPNKIGLAPDQYMTVQNIYRGWSLFGIAVIGALLLTLAAFVALASSVLASRPASPTAT